MFTQRLGPLAMAALALVGLLTAGARRGTAEEAEHPGHLGRRHRHVEHQRQQSRHDGLQDTRTLIASPAKASPSRTTMASKAARLGVPRSSTAASLSEPA